MNYKKRNKNLVIIQNSLKAKSFKEKFKKNIGGYITTSGTKALEIIKYYPQFSQIFIPLDLNDMDYSDFIKFAIRYLPYSDYILIAPLGLSNLDWLVHGQEIDGYIQEPLSVEKFSNYLDSLYNNRIKFGDSGTFPRKTNPYFSGSMFSRG